MAQEQPSNPAAATGKKRRRGKRNTVAEDAMLPAEEAERRRRQRELRAVALRLQSKGEAYNPKKFRRQAARQAAAAAGGVGDGHKPRRASTVQLILIPIFWNRKEEEKAIVLMAVSEAQAVLRGAGVACDTDTTHKLTPGQKYRHWEERGVMLRVEVGPQEAKDGTCLLAQCRVAGEVAQKRQLAVGPELVEAVLAAVGVPAAAAALAASRAPPGGTASGAKAASAPSAAAGRAELPAPAAARDEEEAAPTKKRSKKGKVQKREEEGAAAAPAADAPIGQQPGAAGKPKVPVRSGDELEGDFAQVDLLGSQQQQGKKSKKAKAAGDEAAAGGGDAAAPLSGWPEGEGDRGKAKRKKGKVVKF